MTPIDDPKVVREQYAREDNLRARQALWEDAVGTDPKEVLWRTLVEWQPRQLLEVGGGQGELAERIGRELGAQVSFVDLSPRMVELARARGLDAQVGDVQELPFADGTFDTVVAAWMLYHVPDVDHALAEIARVLQTGGALIAVTNAHDHVAELRELVAHEERLRRHVQQRRTASGSCVRTSRSIERFDADVTVSITDRQKLVAYRDSISARSRPRARGRRAAVRRARALVDLLRDDVIRAVELIQRKRDGEELPADELAELVLGYARGEVPDYQMAAFCMAVYFRGLSAAETFALTDAMIRSGETLDLRSALGRKVVDKHSTGGVGDKTSLAVGPIVAACGVPLGKMSGRGLGHTGGTLDKLESIPGYRTELTVDEYVAQVRDVGVAIIGQTGDLVPADKLLYGLRDVTATVDQLSLIAASIMSKKLAAGAQAMVLDVKVGDGAFMKTQGRRASPRRDDDRARPRCGPRGRLPPHRHGPAARRRGRQRARGARGARDGARARPGGLHGAGARRVRQAARALRPRHRRDRGSSARRGRRRRRHGRGDLAPLDRRSGGTPDESALPEAPVVREVPAPRSGYVTSLSAIGVGMAAGPPRRRPCGRRRTRSTTPSASSCTRSAATASSKAGR